MKEAVANAIYDILIAECGAAPELREQFVTWYRSKAEYPFRFGGALIAATFEPHGNERVKIATYYVSAQRRAAANAVNLRLNAFHDRLARMSPLEKLDWLHKVQRKHTLEFAQGQ